MTDAKRFTFDGQMKASDGVCESRKVEDIIKWNIPGALNVHRAHSVNDRSGTDWWVEHESGRHLSVDAKVREEDWAAKPERIRADDLALETWSVVEKRVPGWTRDPSKRCDYILWLWKDTGRWCMVPFHPLCRVFRDHWESWIKQYKTKKQFTKCHGGYHSECVFVPRREVWAAIYNRFA